MLSYLYNEDLCYEPVGEDNYQRIIRSLESEIGRLKGGLLPTFPVSPAERESSR
jgi:hypothetical protein